MRLLLSIIEGPIDTEIIKSITISLDDFVVIMERLNYVYCNFVENELNQNPKTTTLSQVNDCLVKESFDGDEVLEGFDIFILVKSLSDCNPAAK